MQNDNLQHSILQKIAIRVMLERGLLPDFTNQELHELEEIKEPASSEKTHARDLREYSWCSIDNNDSLDLDQLTYAEKVSNEDVKVWVAIADVDAIINQNALLDLHAKHNTTSIYTTAKTFPMLPEKLSSDLTSLKYKAERLAIVIEMLITDNGAIKTYEVFDAIVKNHAKLNYNSVALWLEGKGPIPEELEGNNELENNIRLQDNVAQKMKSLRHTHGALDLDVRKTNAVFENNSVKELLTEKTNRAKEIIEDFMIAANGIVVRYLSSKNFPSISRVVRTPKRWDRIITLCAELGYKLPQEPDSKALNDFLTYSKNSKPTLYSDLSLSIIKLLGAGEYVVEHPGATRFGHFGLAVSDYCHSTAPNRRYPDLLTQRLLKAAMLGHPIPYNVETLEYLAKHCTEAENLAKKVERQVEKSASAMLLESRIGEHFDGIITGASIKGTWVRLTHLFIEGKLINNKGFDVGHKLCVELVHTDVERGFIDFKAVE